MDKSNERIKFMVILAWIQPIAFRYFGTDLNFAIFKTEWFFRTKFRGHNWGQYSFQSSLPFTFLAWINKRCTISVVDHKAPRTYIIFRESTFRHLIQKLWENVQIAIGDIPNAWIIFINYELSILEKEWKNIWSESKRGRKSSMLPQTPMAFEHLGSNDFQNCNRIAPQTPACPCTRCAFYWLW